MKNNLKYLKLIVVNHHVTMLTEHEIETLNNFLINLSFQVAKNHKVPQRTHKISKVINHCSNKNQLTVIININ